MRKLILITTLVFGFLLGLWEMISHLTDRLNFILPRPSLIFEALIENAPRLLFHTSVTLKEMCLGFVLALIVAFPLAWLMLTYRTSRALLQPLFIVIQCVPMFTLAPIMVIWFGWGFTAIVVPTALMIFFPLTLNIYQGLRSTPKNLLEFFQTNQATAVQTFLKLQLPWAVPHLFAGFRISAAIAGIGAVAGEWAGAQNGLGILMLESRRNVDLEITFSALICLTLLSSSLYLLVVFCEKIALPPRSFFKKREKSLKKSPKIVLTFALIFFLSLFGGGCDQKGVRPKTSATQVRLLLDWLPNPNHVPLYAGIQNGFFREAGIDLVINKMHEEGYGISYLTSDQADLLVNHIPGVLHSMARGAQIKVVGILIDTPLRGLIYRDDPTIKHPSDLSGKILGYCVGGPNTSFLNTLLEHGEIVPKGRKNVSVDLISSLGNRSVDFIYGGFRNIEPAQYASLGITTKEFSVENLGVPSYAEMIVIAKEGSPFCDEQFIHTFQKTLQRCIDYCKQHPEAAFADYLKCHPDKRNKVIAWEKRAWEMTLPLLTDTQTIHFEKLKIFHDWLVEKKIIPFPLNLELLRTCSKSC
ncbi:MAG: ABC transporter substrate-binding protein [Chlamydiia bacterium]|nr:ABC transporter substrate-binding protein [Chlamydiia bacterium]